jgi:hypothetical protein
VIDVGSLLDLADFNCVRCGGTGPVTFTDMAGLEAFLSPVPPLWPGAGAQLMPRSGAFRIDLASLARFGPCHRQCPRDRPAAKPCPYDLTRSVA